MNDATIGGLALAITRFVGLLRAMGFGLGPGAVIDALDAVRAVGLARRTDVYAALHATCVSRHEQDPLFDEAFRVFWRDTGDGHSVGAMPDEGPAPAGARLSPRLAEALQASQARQPDVERLPGGDRAVRVDEDGRGDAPALSQAVCDRRTDCAGPDDRHLRHGGILLSAPKNLVARRGGRLQPACVAPRVRARV